MSRLASGLGLLLGTLGGVCLGWLLAVSLRSQVPEETGPAPGPVTTLGAAASSPALHGVERHAATAGKSAPGTAPEAPRRVVPLATTAELAPLLALDGQPLPEGRGREVARALALLFATLGRVEDFERLVARCVAVGWPAAELLPMIDLLPAEQRLASYDRLLAGPFAGVTLEPVLLANVLESAGAKERAIALLQARLAEGLHENAALRLIALDPKGAAAQLLAAEGITEASTDFLANIISALARAGEQELAWPFIDRIVARGELPTGALDMLEESDPLAGVRIAERLLATQRDSAVAWHWLGRLKQAHGDTSGAFEAYQEAVTRNLSGENLEGLMRADLQRAYEYVKTLDTTSLTGEDVGVLAALALHRGTTEEAFAILARGLEQAPSEYSLLNAIVRVDPGRAAALLGASAATYQGEGRDELVGAYANALRIAGRREEARAAYLEAMSIDGSDVEWIDGLNQIDPAAALAHLESVRAGNDDEEWYQRALADAYQRTGRRAEAQAIYARLSTASAAASLGRSDPVEGRRRLEELLHAEPRNAGHWGQLGEMERDLGNVAAARRAFERAVALEPTSLWYLARLRQVSQPAPTSASSGGPR